MSPSDIIKQFGDIGKMQIEKDKRDFASRYNKYDKSGSIMSNKGHNYTVVPINSHKEAAKYGKYVEWCIAQQSGEQQHCTYTSGGTGRFYFLLAPGYQDIPRKKGPGFPYDEYGESMIAINVDKYGNLTHCTLRWNHDDGANDAMFDLDKNKLSEFLSNTDFHTIFEPYTEEEVKAKKEAFDRLVQEALEKYRNGDNSGFDSINSLSYGLTRVELNNKYNIINTNGELVSNQWFNKIEDFRDGFAYVELNNKYNIINTNGELVSPNQWFDNIWNFRDGFAKVKLNNKYNIITATGEILSPNQWFESMGGFYEGVAEVKLNNKYNFINKNGELVSPNQWFDWVSLVGFRDGSTRVTVDNRYYNMDGEGNLTLIESNTQNKSRVILSEKQVILLKEHYDRLSESKKISKVEDDYSNAIYQTIIKSKKKEGEFLITPEWVRQFVSVPEDKFNEEYTFFKSCEVIYEWTKDKNLRSFFDYTDKKYDENGKIYNISLNFYLNKRGGMHNVIRKIKHEVNHFHELSLYQSSPNKHPRAEKRSSKKYGLYVTNKDNIKDKNEDGLEFLLNKLFYITDKMEIHAVIKELYYILTQTKQRKWLDTINNSVVMQSVRLLNNLNKMVDNINLENQYNINIIKKYYPNSTMNEAIRNIKTLTSKTEKEFIKSIHTIIKKLQENYE
jgi:hypothetical protein